MNLEEKREKERQTDEQVKNLIAPYSFESIVKLCSNISFRESMTKSSFQIGDIEVIANDQHSGNNVHLSKVLSCAYDIKKTKSDLEISEDIINQACGFYDELENAKYIDYLSLNVFDFLVRISKYHNNYANKNFKNDFFRDYYIATEIDSIIKTTNTINFLNIQETLSNEYGISVEMIMCVLFISTTIINDKKMKILDESNQIIGCLVKYLGKAFVIGDTDDEWNLVEKPLIRVKENIYVANFPYLFPFPF